MKFHLTQAFRFLAMGALICAASLLALDIAAIAQTAAPVVAPAGPAVAVQTTAIPSSQTVVDISSLVTTALQLIGLPIATFLVWGFWKGVGLLGLKVDDSVRAVIDQGLQKAIGYGVTQVQSYAAGRPITIDVKNALVKEAADFAQDHIADALAHFSITPAMLNDMLESRLGMMATAAAAPAVAAAAGAQPAQAPAVVAAAAQ